MAPSEPQEQAGGELPSGETPTVTHAFLAAVGAVFGIFLLNAAAYPAFAWFASLEVSPAMLLGVAAITAEVGIIVPLLLILRLANLEPRRSLGLVKPRLAPTLFALVAMIGGGLLLDEIMYLAVQVWPALRSGALDNMGSSIAGATMGEAVFLLLPLALLPAICEETVCRGLILKGLLSRWPSAWLPVVASSLFFGALHLDALHAPVAALMGLLLGVIAIRTGSLWPPMICHLVNNAVSIFTPRLGGPSLNDVLDHGHATGVVIAAIVTLVVGLAGLIWTTRPR